MPLLRVRRVVIVVFTGGCLTCGMIWWCRCVSLNHRRMEKMVAMEHVCMNVRSVQDGVVRSAAGGASYGDTCNVSQNTSIHSNDAQRCQMSTTLDENEIIQFDEAVAVIRREIVAVNRHEGRTYVHTKEKHWSVEGSFKMMLGKWRGIKAVPGEENDLPVSMTNLTLGGNK